MSTYHVAIPSPMDWLEGKGHLWVELAENREADSFPPTWMYLGTVTIDVPVDGTKLREFALEQLNAEEHRIRAKLQMELQVIEEARQRLLSIEHQPS